MSNCLNKEGSNVRGSTFFVHFLVKSLSFVHSHSSSLDIAICLEFRIYLVRYG